MSHDRVSDALKRPPHAWRDPGCPDGGMARAFVVVAWAWLEQPADPADAPERVESGRRAYGRHRVCIRCGISVVYAELFSEGHTYQVPLYGVDLDNLTPMHATPRCEPHALSRDPLRAAAEVA